MAVDQDRGAGFWRESNDMALGNGGIFDVLCAIVGNTLSFFRPFYRKYE